jgi:hypothetical protein
MTTQAGWYTDPQAPHLNRWWDGEQWTSHTATRVTQPAQQAHRTVQALPAYPAASAWWTDEPPRPKPRGPKILAIVGITLLAGYLGLVAVFSLAAHSHTTGIDAPPTCGLRVTAQMPPTTVAFVQLLFGYNTRAEALTKTMRKEGTAVSDDDINAAAGNEVTFAQGLDAIPFAGKAATDANGLATQRRQLAADLLELISGPPTSDLVARIRQHDYDLTTYDALRVDLGLPQHGTCTFTMMY